MEISVPLPCGPGARSTASPISQNIGGQSPTNRARRSALPRSSWSDGLGPDPQPDAQPIDAIDAACSGRPARRCAPAQQVRSGDHRRRVPEPTVLLRSRSGRRPGSLRRRLGIVLYWPIGLLAVISWRYLWRTTPVYRRDEEGGSARPAAAPARRGRPRQRSRASTTASGRCCIAATPSGSSARGSTPSRTCRRSSPPTPTRPRPRTPRCSSRPRAAARSDGGRRRVRRADARPVGRAGAGRAPDADVVPVRDAGRPPRGRADRVPGAVRGRGARCSRSSRGRGQATGCRTCSTTTSCWPRRSSSTCGPRHAWGWRATPAAGCRGGVQVADVAGRRSPTRPLVDRAGRVSARLHGVGRRRHRHEREGT